MSLTAGNVLGGPLPGLGRALTPAEAAKTLNYLKLITKWQKVHRLVGSTEPAWMAQNVIADSLAFLAVLPSTMRALVDIGSGAGIPGVPIAIVRSDVHVVLIESRQRRVSFLYTVVRELGLANVEVAGARLEQLVDAYPERFDAAVMRCAGSVRDLIPKVLPILVPGGVVVVSASSTAGPVMDGKRLEVRARDGGTRCFHRYAKA